MFFQIIWLPSLYICTGTPPNSTPKSILVSDWDPRSCLPFNLLTMPTSKLEVVMLPLPTQSHLNQLLHLAAIISSRNLPVHFVGSATHNRQVKLRATSLNPNAAATIHFHDLPTPPIATPEPNPTISNKQPLHQSPAVMAYLGLRHEIGFLVQKLSQQTSKIILIHDRLVGEAVKVAVSIPSVESYTFTCLSALNLFCVLWELTGRPFDVEEELNRLPSVREFIPESTLKFIANRPDHFDHREGDIYNTCRLVEGKYIHLLRRKEIGGGKKQWAIMPTLFQNFLHNDNVVERRRFPCLEWLDKQAPRSVMYLSFGSSISLTNEEIREMAAGLEESGKKFIWVVRESDKADIFAGEEKAVELPEGFEERVRERGIIVREWAPQMEILSHESTGGFMTHCGWNSCFESLVSGVPVAAWPMHSDQPLNAIFLTEVLRVGVIVRAWEAREKLVEAAEIKRAVEILLSGEGERIRKRAEEVSADINKSMEEGGELQREVDNFITHITR